MKMNKGVTLIALVITVIVMLIIAGVAISAITNSEGLISNSKGSAIEYKKQSMLEAIDRAEIELQADHVLEGTEINIENLKEKIKEVSKINEEEYIIHMDYVEQTITITDPKTGIVIDISIEEQKVKVEISVVEDIKDAVKPTIEYVLDPTEGTYAEEVKIIITVKEELNGIARTQFDNNEEKTYTNEKQVIEEYTVNKNGRYTYTAVSANGKKASVYINVKNTMTAGDILIESLDTDPTNNPVEVKISYDENITIGGQALTNENRFQYSIGENNWETANEAETRISVEKNGTVYARYYDGKEGYKTEKLEIGNIDKLDPTTSTIASSNITTITATLTVTGADATATTEYSQSGIQKYVFYKDGAEYTTVTTTEGTASTQLTFTANSHNCYVIVYDNAGNYLASSTITVTKHTHVNACYNWNTVTRNLRLYRF